MIKLSKLQCLTLTAMFGAIMAILMFTPIGFPQIPLIGSATVIHIPVIIGAIIMGPKYGALLGFLFGLASMIFASTASLALNRFAFSPFVNVPGTDSGSLWAIVIAFGPRILVGVVAALVFMGIMKLAEILPLPKLITTTVVTHKDKTRTFTWHPKEPRILAIVLAAGAASMTNTLLVLNLLYAIFRDQWSYAREAAGVVSPQITYAFVSATIVGFGIPEAIAAMVIAPPVCLAIYVVAKRMPQKQGAA